jgi:hypothetical protein
LPTRHASEGAVIPGYSELAFFDGGHFAHIVDYEESWRLQQIRRRMGDAVRGQARQGRSPVCLRLIR